MQGSPNIGLQSEARAHESTAESVAPVRVSDPAAPASPIDRTLITPLRDLGPDDFRQLIRMYLDEAAGRVARLQDLGREGEAAELGRVAHALRGTSAAFGASGLAGLCAEIEAAAGEGVTPGLKTLIEAVATEFALVSTALIEELR
jgi:HPt (histidine-containing phosphotransfer) domain-containing protein